MKNITIRDSGNKEVLEAYFLNHEGQPYNLENKTVTFMENKDGDKFVSDPNVQIVNATAGFVRYTLQSQVHSAPGIAWFEINDDSGLVDSTGNFNIRVENGLRATADNTTYIGALEKLKQQMEALIQQADGELKAELQKAEQQLNQELQNFRNQYNSLSADFQNQFKTAQNARQQDYNNQKNAINQDWTNNKNSIWEQWNNDKANIDKQAQDTVQAIKSNAKQVLDRDQADWNAKQNQWDSTFSAIVKEWQVKTNSLNATVQDLTNKFNTIIGQVSDLMNNKLPTINAKADAIQEKVNALRASLRQIDWNSFAKKNDLSKIKFVKDSLNQYGDSFQDIQFVTQEADGTFKINIYNSDWTANRVSWLLKNTKSYNIEANTNLNDIKAPGLYHCSGASNIVNVPGGEDNWFDMIVNSDEWNGSQTFYATNSNQLYVRTWHNGGFTEWRRLANIDDLSKVKIKLQSLDQNGDTFTNIQTANKQSDGSYVINIYDNDWTANKVSWLLKNTKSYNIEANTNLNDIKAPGLYHCSGASNIVNVPGGEDNWFDMIVNSDEWNGSQTFYATNSNQLYVRTWHNGGFTEWSKFATMDSIAYLSDRLRSFTMQQDMFQHRVDYDNPSGTISNDTVDFNNYRETGILKVVNCLIQNGPYKSDNRHTVFLKITNLDGQTQYQTVYEGDNLYGRKLYNGSGQWHKYTNTPI